ncbi:hypothetical protein aldrigsur_35 [Escherichia phage aldrigsur]|nr:hypothetical protein aldrigsur_35 [Escherichia phage aldrigsur]
MSKKVRIEIIGHVSQPHWFSGAVRDTTIGQVYDAELLEAGELDPVGYELDEPGYSFVDDEGDECLAFVSAHKDITIKELGE